MTVDLALVLALLLAAVAMFALNRPRMDVVGLLMIVALPLTGVITAPEALAGFADPSIVLIAALFVIGEALVRTGVAQRLGDLLITRAGHNETRLIVLLMILVAGVGSVMSSTGVVAIFIPVVLRVARSAGIAPARLLMPLSVAALISGMMTLVATAPNLVVHAELRRHGLDGFGFFAFSPFGLPILALAIVYMLFARRLLAPGSGAEAGTTRRRRPRLAEWIEDYALEKREYRLRLPPGSPLAGQMLRALDLRATAGVNIIAIERGPRFGRRLIRPLAETVLEAGDVLMLDVFRPQVTIEDVTGLYGLERLPLTGRYFADRRQEIGLAEVMVPATSRLLGKTVVEARFRTTHDLAVIGLRHGRKAMAEDVLNRPLAAGDTLLVAGPWRAIRKIQEDLADLVVLALPVEVDDVLPAGNRAPFALGILALVIALMVGGVVPNVIAALIGCLLLGLFGCIDMTHAYRAIHWQSLVLIVGMLPFSLALQKTGGIALAADGFIALFGEAGPRLALAALFALTAGLGLFISNTATAVLMAPVALAIAGEMGLSPYPFAMTVALAASTAFMTPVSSPVNTLVVGPGNYRFMDFVKVGVPLSVLTLVAAVLLVPLVLPFSP
ncbi:SLC13 family permease [Zavarzinia compransoris]|uniref:SLC13 family permease n=1 Tax=Zavarzinia compransoris TaxID=1264899 RepID=A0A317ECF8_9PROT|nr:SLC13 family permease [Zavarzinia compransoris]PWR23974.1 SLC13 family permease [Zavarzinia compransoris]TDP48227.1 TrkA family protein [Zavarzinia compransoris]